MPTTALLKIKNLSISFTHLHAFRQSEINAVRDISLTINPGEIVAVVGASGSGKSLLAHSILGLLPHNAVAGGSLLFKGQELTASRIQKLRGKDIALIPQGVSYLDPLMKIEAQLKGGDKCPPAKISQVLARFGLADRTKNLYPFELSGGMARRVLVSTAALHKPSLIIADEPTPGLHEEAAAEIITYLKDSAAHGAGVLLISHDLELALTAARRVVVLYAGYVMEDAMAGDFGDGLRHPYTRALWNALPQNGFSPLPGCQPYGDAQGCPFYSRCQRRTPACLNDIPLRKERGGYVRCIAQ